MGQRPGTGPGDTAEFVVDPEPQDAQGFQDPGDTGETPVAQPQPQPQSAPAQPRQPRHPDELTDPLPEPAPERAPERTPIFEEMESTWFGTRRAVVPPTEDSPQPAQPSQPAEPSPASQRPAPTAASASAVPPPRTDRPASAVPPGAARQAATRTERPESSGGTGPSGGTGGGAPWRASPNDERWRQAEQLRQPSAGGVTTSGLPRRVPRANLVPGAAEPRQQAAPAGPLVSRAPDDVRGRLTNLRRGIQQGRQAGSSAGQTDGDFGPTYQ
jgi:hypothetical protein